MHIGHNTPERLQNELIAQMSQVIFGMLVSSGRITMLGPFTLDREGGSYRTIPALLSYGFVLACTALVVFQGKFFCNFEDEYIAAGDEVVVSKAGKETYGLDRFFAGLQQRFHSGSLILVFFPVNIRKNGHIQCGWHKLWKSAEEKATSKAKAAAKKEQKTGKKKKSGRQRQQEQR